MTNSISEETPQERPTAYEEEARELRAEPRQEMLPQSPQSASTTVEESEPEYEYVPCEWDIRLIPPPIPQQKLKVKLNFTGYESPRIAYNPEHD